MERKLILKTELKFIFILIIVQVMLIGVIGFMSFMHPKDTLNNSETLPSNEFKIQVKTFFNEETMYWGYNVYVNNMLYIRQKTLPAGDIKRGFYSREDAEKTGKLIVRKLRNKHIPPDISITELDSLGVVY